MKSVAIHLILAYHCNDLLTSIIVVVGSSRRKLCHLMMANYMVSILELQTAG